jgi:hypothetical protein
LPIINASNEVIEEINKMLGEEGVHTRNLRLAAKIDWDGDKLSEGFQLFQSELTLNDQYQEFNGFNIIIANILLKMYGSFTLACVEENGKTKVEIRPERTGTPGRYRSAIAAK